MTPTQPERPMGLIDELSSWYFRIFGRSDLRPYERVCVQAWRQTIGDTGATLLDGQLTSCDLVQRQMGGRGVCLYRLRRPSLEQVEAQRFPSGVETAIAAIVHLRRRGETRRNRVTLMLVKGLLFSLEFQQSPRALGWQGLSEGAFEVLEVRAVTDPMVAEGPMDGGRLAPLEWLESLAAQWGLAKVRAPLVPAERARRVSALGLWLPDDYTTTCESCDGFEIGPVWVRGVAELDPLPLGEAGAVILVEGQDGRRHGVWADGTPGLLCFTPDTEEPRQVGMTLRSVLESELERASLR